MYLKQCRIILKKNSGRNNQGVITVRGKVKKKKHFYYKINFYNKIFNIKNEVQWVGKRRQRNSFLLLYKSANSFFQYKIAPAGVYKRDETTTMFKDRPLKGNSMPLYSMPLVADVNTVEMQKNQGGTFCRAAGTSMRVVRKHSRVGYVTLKLPSKQVNYVKWDCLGVVGQVSNENFFLKNIGKAGTSFHNGKRPQSRGVAMNPVDHPMGGGEGKSSGGRQSCSPWGWKTKGPKSRSKKKKKTLKKLKDKVNKYFD